MRSRHWLTGVFFLFIVVTWVSSSYAGGHLKGAIAGAWLFEDSIDDGVVSDVSENGNDCDIVGDGVTIVPGKFGHAVKIVGESGGSGPYLNCGAGESISGLTNFTLMVWFNTEFPDSTNPLMMKGVGGGEWGFNWSGRRELFWSEISIGGARMDLAYTETFLGGGPDIWHHGAFTFDGTTRKLYANGELDNETGVLLGEAPFEGEIEISATELPLLIGGWAVGEGANRFASKGSMDEAAIFNVALSQEDIQAIMNNGLGKTASVSPAGKLAATWAQIKAR